MRLGCQIWFTIVILHSHVVFCGSVPSGRDAIQAYRRAFATGRFSAMSKAAAKLEASVLAIPASEHQSTAAEAFFYLGLARHHLGQNTRALSALARARQLEPGNPRVHENLGAVAAALQQWAPAAAHYGEAAALEPTAPELHVSHAMMWYRAGHAFRGARLFANIVNTFGTSATARYELARSNELLLPNAEYERDVQSNFTVALEIAWAALRADAPGWTLVRREDWPDQVPLDGPMMGHRSVGDLPPPPSKAIFVAEFRDIEVCGNDGILLHQETRRVYLPSFGPQIPLHKNLHELPPHSSGTSAAVGRPAVLVVQLFAVGYYHWLLEVLPRLLVGLSQYPGAAVIVPSNDGHLKLFMNRTLELIGITKEQLILYDLPNDPAAAAGCRLVVPHLVHVDWAPKTGTAPGIASHLPPRHALLWLRRALRPQDAPDRPERVIVWIQRAAAATRRISNEARLLNVMRGLAAQLQFRVVVFSDVPMPLPQRATFDLFSRAAVVIGMHGAGLAHIVVSCRGTAVLEFTLPEAHATYYAHLCRAVGLSHFKLQLRGAALYSQPAVEVPEVEFRRTLQRLMAAIPPYG